MYKCLESFLNMHKLATFFPQDEPSGWSCTTGSDVVEGESLSLEAGQAVQLEDGSTAYLHHILKGISQSQKYCTHNKRFSPTVGPNVS